MKGFFDNKDFIGDQSSVIAPVNLIEDEHCYRLDVAIPGVKRENIFVKLSDNLLSIVTINKQSKSLADASSGVHEFDEHPFERNLQLPETADTQFMSAEYRSGVLSIHMMKSTNAIQQGMRQLVVY